MTSKASNFNRLPSGRSLALTASVLLHVLGLWAVQRTIGNYMAPEPEPPLVVVMELPPRAEVVPKPVLVAPSLPAPVPKAVAKPAPLPAAKAPVATPAAPIAASPAVVQPAPTSIPAPPAPTTPATAPGSGVLTAATGTASASTTAAGSAIGSGNASAGAGRLELSPSDAQWLNKPEPAYPPLSRRRDERGRVVVSVLMAANGTAEKVELKVSSGFTRLDQAALTAVWSWRCLPGAPGSVCEGVWFSVPIRFNIE